MKANLYRLAIIMLCVAGIFFTGGSVKAQGIVIAVADESTVAGPAFSLGDIATISGDDSARIASLKAIRLGYSPLPGQSTVLTRELLGLRLSAGNHDFSGITWQVPLQFRITSLSQLVDKQTIISQAEQYLKRRLANSDVIITLADLPHGVRVPAGDLTFTAEMPYGVKFNAPSHVHIGIVVAGQPFATAKLKYNIKKYQQVVVASRLISAGSLVTADSVIFERRDVGRMPPGYITDINKVLGFVVKRQIVPGATMTDSMVEKPVLIKRGQNVRIVAVIGGIEATALGVVMQNGSMGQLVRVQNVSSKKIITGQIIDEMTVKVK